MPDVLTDRFVSSVEAAKLLGVSRDKLYEFTRRDEAALPYYQERERGRIKFRYSELIEWYASNFRRA